MLVQRHAFGRPADHAREGHRARSPHLLETTGDVHGILRWELSPESGGTTLVFTSTLDLPEEFRSRTLAGWHFHLMALRRALAGGSADLVELPEWPAIHDRYEKRDG